MHEFDVRIAAWRQTMADDFRGRAEELEELESHLRDALDGLVRAGKTPDEAWPIALAQLGPPRRLAEEFDKLPRAGWLPVRIIGVGGLIASAWLAGLLTPRLGGDGLLALHIFLITLGYSATLLAGALAGCYLLARLFQELDASKLVSLRRALVTLSALGAGLTAIGVLLGAAWLLRQQGTFWEWDPREIGGLTIFLWNAAMLAALCQSSLRRLTALVALSMVGNAVVILGWFGAIALAKQQYVILGGWTAILTLAATQIAVAALALAPARCLQTRRG